MQGKVFVTFAYSIPYDSWTCPSAHLLLSHTLVHDSFYSRFTPHMYKYMSCTAKLYKGRMESTNIQHKIEKRCYEYNCMSSPSQTLWLRHTLHETHCCQ